MILCLLRLDHFFLKNGYIFIFVDSLLGVCNEFWPFHLPPIPLSHGTVLLPGAPILFPCCFCVCDLLSLFRVAFVSMGGKLLPQA